MGLFAPASTRSGEAETGNGGGFTELPANSGVIHRHRENRRFDRTDWWHMKESNCATINHRYRNRRSMHHYL
jgi:hypothetical protein